MPPLNLLLLLLALVLLLVQSMPTAASPPPEWLPRIAGAQMLYTPDDTNVKYTPTMGNGYIATTINVGTTYIGGVFNGHGSTTPSHRARLPATTNIAITNGKPAGAALDIQRGTYYRQTSVQGVQVEQRFYAHRVNRTLLIMELQALLPPGHGPITVSLTSSSGGSSSDVNLTTLQSSSQVTVVNGSTLVPEYPIVPVTVVSMAYSTVPASITLSNNNTVFFVTAARTSLDTAAASTVAGAQADYKWAMANTGSLHATHMDEWQNQVWASGIEVEGRMDIARAVNTSLFAILSSVRADWPYSISPGGLTDGYNGHTFWDAETWMYPSVLALHPDLAAMMLQYRFARIPGAELKAKSYKPPYSGAMFPWESAFTGEEVCPTWAATGLREIHISGDIAFAVWQYWRATKDRTWLSTVGWPLLSGIADFWVSKAQVNSSGVANIDDVIPPDEYHDHVNNSVYTNTVARLALTFATTAAGLVGKAANPAWAETASKLVILFNGTYHPEYEGYAPPTVIKQADVILLGFPLMVEGPEYHMTKEVRKADLDIYGAVTDANGPAMTWSMQSVGYLDTGELALAASNFNRSFANVQAPFDVWAETPTGGTNNFVTGAGGFLQGVLFGYVGLRLKDDGLHWKPLLFEGTTLARVRSLNYLGAQLTLEYNASTMSLLQTSAGTPLQVQLADGSQRAVVTGEAMQLPSQQVMIHAA